MSIIPAYRESTNESNPSKLTLLPHTPQYQGNLNEENDLALLSATLPISIYCLLVNGGVFTETLEWLKPNVTFKQHLKNAK